MRWGTLADTNKNKPIYITLTEEHLGFIDKTLTIMLIRLCKSLIRYYSSENLELEIKIFHLEEKTDIHELMRERYETHTSFYEHTLYDTIRFLEDIKEGIIEYGFVSVDINHVVFEEGERSQEELNAELEKLEQEKKYYSKRHTQLITEYQTKLREKRKIYVTDPTQSPKGTRPPRSTSPIENEVENEVTEDISNMKRIMGISFFVGIFLAITIGFAITMGN